jgi:hypothetical protein
LTGDIVEREGGKGNPFSIQSLLKAGRAIKHYKQIYIVKIFMLKHQMTPK